MGVQPSANSAPLERSASNATATGIPPPHSSENEDSTLRQRSVNSSASSNDAKVVDAKKEKEEKDKQKEKQPKRKAVFGKTSSGEAFEIPQTHSFIHDLLSPTHPKSHLDLLTLSLLTLQVIFFVYLLRTPRFDGLKFARWFYLIYFTFWRMAYNVGLGYVLKRQSEEKWIVGEVKRRGWMRVGKKGVGSTIGGGGGEDGEEASEAVRRWLKKELESKMGSDYDFDSLPVEYNVWILFRHLVDLILLNDFVAYSLFGFSWMQFSPNHSTFFHVLRWIGGWSLVGFNLWVKMDAHRIIKDFGWYWGDAFFLSHNPELVFDGSFLLAPHPMYSIGYLGFYGLSLIAGSQLVFYVSLLAHACQFGFLLGFENPHIERTYGTKKPLATRVPLKLHGRSATSPSLSANPTRSPLSGPSGISSPKDSGRDTSEGTIRGLQHQRRSTKGFSSSSLADQVITSHELDTTPSALIKDENGVPQLQTPKPPFPRPGLDQIATNFDQGHVTSDSGSHSPPYPSPAPSSDNESIRGSAIFSLNGDHETRTAPTEPGSDTNMSRSRSETLASDSEGVGMTSSWNMDDEGSSDTETETEANETDEGFSQHQLRGESKKGRVRGRKGLGIDRVDTEVKRKLSKERGRTVALKIMDGVKVDGGSLGSHHKASKSLSSAAMIAEGSGASKSGVSTGPTHARMMSASGSRSRSGINTPVTATGYGYGLGAPTNAGMTVMTRHDLDNKYFKKDLTVLFNWDLFRATDFSLAQILIYSFFLALFPSFSPSAQKALLFLNALAWRLFHSFALGLALKEQSERKWIVRHFVKRYGSIGAVEEAFRNWKAIYNESLCMTYVSYIALAWQFYSLPKGWTVDNDLLRQTMGLLFILVHVWASQSAFEVLGPFGWFYGDFFIEDYPSELYYTGIYRFLNNPERSMGGAAFFGFALVTGSRLLLVLAVASVLSHWWFLSFVENPHMQKLYGKAIRKDAGVTKTIKTVAKKNASRAPNQLSRVVKEVQGTIEKVGLETSQALEEFLERSAPKWTGYVEGTKLLIKESGERLVISRVAHDLSPWDAAQYSLTVLPSRTPSLLSSFSPTSTTPTANGPPRFHFGEPITLRWRAPSNHARGDWVGVYRYGAAGLGSKLVTRISSKGKWVGIYMDEWVGDKHFGQEELGDGQNDNDGKGKKEPTRKDSIKMHEGTLTFSGDKLPLEPGVYEFRYHHDGKHNVMARAGPVEIFVDQPQNPDSLISVHDTLSSIVSYCLGLDSELVPKSSLPLLGVSSTPTLETTEGRKDEDGQRVGGEGDNEEGEEATGDDTAQGAEEEVLNDPDDFTIMTEGQAEKIARAIGASFGIELGKDVVIADANITRLSQTVEEARKLLRPFRWDEEHTFEAEEEYHGNGAARTEGEHQEVEAAA